MSTGTSGLPTAFVAEWRKDAAGPKIGEMGLAPAGLCTAVTPLQDEPVIGGSSDVGDVSWNAPTMAS